MTEDDLQRSVKRYLDLLGLDWCHVPNEGKRSRGNQFKHKGLKSGVPDCLIFNPHNEYSGTAIELKIENNKQSDNQKEWELKLINCGWSYHVCRSLDEVIELIKLNYRK